jgi:DNA repair protein RadC
MVYLQHSKMQIQDSKHVAQVFLDLLLLEDRIDRDKEHFYVMHLDIKNRVKLVEVVSVGTLSSSLVHPRETFRRAVCQGAHAILVAHNHPSGECEPSEEDSKITKLLSLNLAHFVARQIDWRGGVYPLRYRADRPQRRAPLRCLLIPIDTTFDLLQTAIN